MKKHNNRLWYLRHKDLMAKRRDEWRNKNRERSNACKRILQRKHYRIKNGLDPDLPLLLAPKGTGYRSKEGYRLIVKKGHPNAQRGKGIIFEHIFIMAQYLGRPLRKGENVHHKNGIRDDNRIENLELWSIKQPPGQRIEDKIKWAKDLLEEYGYEISLKLPSQVASPAAS